MQNVTLRQLRSALAIRAYGKIVSAAKHLGLTAPAVTLQLKQLESEVGLSLFDRTQDGMRPTAAGLAVLEAARAIGIKTELFEASTDGEIDAAFQSIAQQRIPALIVVSDPRR